MKGKGRRKERRRIGERGKEAEENKEGGGKEEEETEVKGGDRWAELGNPRKNLHLFRLLKETFWKTLSLRYPKQRGSFWPLSLKAFRTRN